MPTTTHLIQNPHNDLLHAQLAAAFDAGDMDTVRKLNAVLDAQQLSEVRKALAASALAANQ